MNTKAEGRSISFYPSSLYQWAETHGQKQEPRMSASAVVCTALSEYRDRIEPKDTKEAELLTAARKIGLTTAIDVLATHRAKRRKGN
jgi:hypothetical protein